MHKASLIVGFLIFSLYIVIGQSIVSATTYEANDGLHDRIVYSGIEDSSDRLWLLLPNAIQLIYQNKVTTYYKFHTYKEITQMSIQGNDFYFVTADAQVLRSQLCKASVTSFDTIVPKGLYTHIQLVSQDGIQYIQCEKLDSVELLSLTVDYQTKSVVSYSKSPTSDAVLLTVDTKYELENNRLLVQKKDSLYTFNLSVQPCEVTLEPKLYTSSCGNTYISCKDKLGTYLLDSTNHLKLLSKDKVISAAKTDKYNNTILCLGSIESGYVDEVLMLSNCQDENLDSYNIVLDISNTIIDIQSQDFTKYINLFTFNGAFHIAFQNKGIKKLFQKEHISKSSFGHVVRGITKIDSTLYFVKEGGGLYTQSNETIARIDNGKMPYGLTSLINIKDSLLIIGAYNKKRHGQVHLYTLNNNKTHTIEKPFYVMDLSISNNKTLVSVGFIDKNPWIDITNIETFDTKTISLDSMVNKQTTRVKSVECIDNFTYIGTNKELLIYDLDRECFVSNSLTKFFENNYILSISDDTRFIYIGTYENGLYRVSKADDSITNYSNKTVLKDNRVANITQDHLGNYWISTFDGISYVDDEFNALYKDINTKEGVSESEFNCNAAYMDKPQGKIYFGSINGITEIDIEKFIQSSPQSILTVNSIEYFQKDKSYLINLNDWNSEQCNNIEIVGSDSIKIQLIPNTLEKRILNYSTLEEYTFDIIGPASTDLPRNNKVYSFPDSVSNGTPYKKETSGINLQIKNDIITFHPPTEGTYSLIATSRLTGSETTLCSISAKRDIDNTVFNILLLLTGFLISSSLAYLIILRIRRVNKLEQSATKKLAEAEMFALHSQMNPHFVFNSLGAIQYYLHKNEPEIVEKYIVKFSRLIRQFLDSSIEKTITLDNEVTLLKNYIDLEILRFDDKFTYSINVDPTLNMSTTIPSMFVQPFVENAIKHGLELREESGGILLLEFKKISNNIVQILIEDNGIGRKESKLNPRTLDTHIPRASKNVSERIKLYNQLHSKRIHLNIIDKYSEGQGNGTTVILNIKVI